MTVFAVNMLWLIKTWPFIALAVVSFVPFLTVICLIIFRGGFK